jgi:hypothetical protein
MYGTASQACAAPAQYRCPRVLLESLPQQVQPCPSGKPVQATHASQLLVSTAVVHWHRGVLFNCKAQYR